MRLTNQDWLFKEQFPVLLSKYTFFITLVELSFSLLMERIHHPKQLETFKNFDQ